MEYLQKLGDDMRFIGSILMLVLLSTVACNKAPEVESNTTSQAPAQPVAAVAEAEYTPQAGGQLELADGTSALIVSVGDFDAKPADYASTIAIEGRVQESYPERGAFILIDCARMDECSSGCCPQATVPVTIAVDQTNIVIPAAAAYVLVIADVSLTETGYSLDVKEVRQAT